MKKALFVSTVGGFVAQFEMQDIEILQQMGYEVHCAANFDLPMYQFQPEEMEKAGIHLHSISIQKSPFSIYKNGRAFCRLRRIIKEEGITLVHCHTPVGGCLARLATLGRSHMSVLYTAHGFHFYKGAPLRNWLVYYPIERVLARFTDRLITINHEDFELAQKFHYKKGGKACKIPSVGLDTKRFSSTMSEQERLSMREKLGVPKQAFHLVTIAELCKNKNHQVVLRALAQLGDADIFYTICGRGFDQQEVKDLIDELGLQKQVKLLGYRTDGEYILQTADAFAFPSIREGLGMAPLEAMACQVPVIAADNRGTREYMRNHKNGLVCPAMDVQKFATAIRYLKEHPTERKQMGVCGRQAACRFSKEKARQEMEKIYKEL